MRPMPLQHLGDKRPNGEENECSSDLSSTCPQKKHSCQSMCSANTDPRDGVFDRLER